MDASVQRRTLWMVLFFAAVYLVIGIAFAAFSDGATTNAMHLIWRRLAWLVSGLAFAAHIIYEHFGRSKPPRTTALNASAAAALGAGGLAVAANIHEWMAGPRYRLSMVVALVAWPLLTLVPAFLVAMIGATVLNRWFPRSEAK